MNNATSSNPLEKLAHLSQQRTARTDRLYEAVQALLAQLDRSAEVGDTATVDGFELCVMRVPTNVGEEDFWVFGNGAESCHLEVELGVERYCHGDFNALLVGPNRDQLIAFAERAGRLVESLIASREATVAELAQAEIAVISATAQVQP